MLQRRKAREIRVGDRRIGAHNPILVQSMTSTLTEDLPATLAQVRRLEEAGCEAIRVACPNEAALANLAAIKRAMRVPLIADIHFSHRYALAAIEAGVDKVRLNPGNIGGKKKVQEVTRAAKDRGVSMRIGVNSGSVEKDLLAKHGWPSPEAMVESAMRHVSMLEELDFQEFCISIKSTDCNTLIEANRELARRCEYPLHLGVTEAGLPGYGSLKSAVGLGSLLLDGIGDTIRVSLAADPVEEIPVCFDVLKATGRRVTSPELIACPTCGRIEIDLEKLVKEVKARVEAEHPTLPVKISILGCVVNGPGEASEADIGVAGGKGSGVIYRAGKQVKVVKEGELLDALMQEVERYAAEREAKSAAPAG
ncbi:MAG TPA: flavodoxin-dependent (E)-4-hydroxy-3-methylbut-2-enyl-diphosphate synthase [Planctomycetota bacterium]|nr:flavodoxin-dependent (E)-4-hydroxy-3-methylbut-2-enyl-diphosphate synthase [Planctomycetota bacterium]